MEKWLWMVHQESNDPLKQQEFEDWLDDHMAHTLTFPGVVRCTLYRNRGRRGRPETKWAECQARNLSIYEIETDDIEKTWELIRQQIDEWHKIKEEWHPQHKMIYRALWQQVSPPKERPAKK
ncbi:MAG: hypothetical protein HYX92_15245 [Chloroflexi bacterium]|nr:hypothetical protein [Chloroflexota bacterium]